MKAAEDLTLTRPSAWGEGFEITSPFNQRHVLCAAGDDDRPNLPDEPHEPPFDEDGDWDEPNSASFDDDAFFDFCEIDDAPEPDPRDYWDDSLDREWNCAPAVGGNDE